MTSLAIDRLFQDGRPARGVLPALRDGLTMLRSWGHVLSASAQAARGHDDACAPAGRGVVLDAFYARS